MYEKHLAQCPVYNTCLKMIALVKTVTFGWKHFLILQIELAMPSTMAPRCPISFKEHKIYKKG